MYAWAESDRRPVSRSVPLHQLIFLLLRSSRCHSRHTDPLEPVLRTVAGDKVLQVIGDGNVLALSSSQEVLGDG